MTVDLIREWVCDETEIFRVAAEEARVARRRVVHGRSSTEPQI